MASTTTALEAPVARRQSQGLWRDAFGRLIKNRLAIVGGLLVLLLAFIAIAGPFISGTWLHDFRDQNVALTAQYGGRPVPPLSEPGYILGTDKLGRDLLARIFDGAQISMTVALVVQAVVLLIGIPVGAIAGWFGGRIDNYLMRFTDVVYAFPDLLFIIILTMAFKETWFGRAMDGLLLVFVAIGIVSWITMARLVRGQLLSLKETEFVEAARAIGVPDRRIVTRHLLPNAVGPVIVAVTLGIPGAILAEATLAFIGIGAQAPRASWGSLIDDGRDFIRGDPHLVLYPALAVAIALLSFTFLGDGLRDALDPKLKGKQ
ncbi:MAG TPA: ABC transporter permease [Candidatus Limnocylindria bacterium]|nr:ABC transporter permease [Candidatus Limnocylindria bacterium]